MTVAVAIAARLHKTMTTKKKLLIALDTTLGWSSVHGNWQNMYPDDYMFEPQWLDLARFSERSNKPRQKSIFRQVFRRLQMAKDANQAMWEADADAALIGNMALNLLVHRSKMPVFTMIDATQQQLQSFGDAYGIYPSTIELLEDWKHRVRCRAYQACAGIFSFSEWAAKSLTQDYGVDATRVHIVPPGADLQRWQKSRRDLRIGQICNILFVGGDFERKGGAILLDWATHTEEKNWRLHIVTRSSLVSNDPRVTIYDDIGYEDPRLTDLFALADIFVLPTLIDCSSLAIQEALAAGLPVVTSNVGGLSELIIEGTTGYSVPVANRNLFSEKMSLLIGDPARRSRMSEAAAEDARLRFDAKGNVLKILQIIADCVNQAEAMPLLRRR